MRIWITSDFHFGHDKEFVWKERGFSSIEEMNETLVDNFNAVVNPEDTVYVLGDIVLKEISNIDYFKRLENNNIHIDYKTLEKLHSDMFTENTFKKLKYSYNTELYHNGIINLEIFINYLKRR